MIAAGTSKLASVPAGGAVAAAAPAAGGAAAAAEEKKEEKVEEEEDEVRQGAKGELCCCQAFELEHGLRLPHGSVSNCQHAPAPGGVQKPFLCAQCAVVPPCLQTPSSLPQDMGFSLFD